MIFSTGRRQSSPRRNQETGPAVIRLAVTAVAVALIPVTVIAVCGYVLAWWRGWPPRRLCLAAAWCSPLAAGWLGAATIWPAGLPGPAPASWWLRLAVAPYRGWRLAELAAIHGDILIGVLVIAPLAIPAGLLAGGLAWARRRFRMAMGTGGAHPGSPARFDARLWVREARTARAIAMSSFWPMPLMRADGSIVAGATIRAVGHQVRRAAAIPYERLRSHQVIIGSTGTGKTTLLLRLWAAFMSGGMQRHADGLARRPLLVVLDCKGGESSRQTAARARAVLHDAGAAVVASWPDNPLSLWGLPSGQLVTTLLDLIEHGTGGAAYYADIMESLVTLAVGAPPGPPASSAEFLRRLDATWLAAAYTAAGNRPAAAAAQSGRKGIDDVALRFRALWRRLGPGLDGGGSFGDADAWYCTLEGTGEPAVAEAQARALTDLLAAYALTSQREILLSVDEFSSVSRRLPIWRLYERARSLGLAVQVTAQSWEGLGHTDDDRNRVAATAEGGIWLLRTPRPEPATELAGTRTTVWTTRLLSGRHTWQTIGASVPKPLPVADPDIIRRLDVGQAAYIYQGGVTYLHIKPPAYAPVPQPVLPEIPALPSAEPPTWPQVSWRGPVPALPPAATQSLPQVFPGTEPLAGGLAAPEEPAQPTSAREAPRLTRPQDAPTPFTQAMSPRQTETHDS
jgi:hypothetical protein